MWLVVGIVIFVALASAAVWLLQRADAEPAARAEGRAPDPAEEARARRSARRRFGVLSGRARERRRRG